MRERKEKLRQTIQADHAASLAIFNRVTADQWNQSVPSDEGVDWKARDVLSHVAVSEGGQLVVIQRVLAGNGGVPFMRQIYRTTPPYFDIRPSHDLVSSMLAIFFRMPFCRDFRK